MDNYIEIPLDSIRFDIAASVRNGIDPATIARYAERWREYKEDLAEYESRLKNDEPCELPEYPFPPIKAAAVSNGNDSDKTTYDCPSGQHRGISAIHEDMKTIRAEIVTGTPSDLLKIAIEENKAHGKAFTPADQRRCILAAHEAFPDLGCRPLAKMIGCSKTQVNRVLNEQDKSDKPCFKAKSKQKAQCTEPVEEESSMTIPQFCDYVLDTIHSEADVQDAETLQSLNNLAVGIVKYLAEHDSIKSLQRRLVSINISK